MRNYRAMFWIELEAIDRAEAEEKAQAFIKKKKLKATLYKIEEG